MDKKLESIRKLYLEIFEPVYPKGVKTGTVTKSGVQGSVIKKKQYQFNSYS